MTKFFVLIQGFIPCNSVYAASSSLASYDTKTNTIHHVLSKRCIPTAFRLFLFLATMVLIRRRFFLLYLVVFHRNRVLFRLRRRWNFLNFGLFALPFLLCRISDPSICFSVRKFSKQVSSFLRPALVARAFMHPFAQLTARLTPSF